MSSKKIFAICLFFTLTSCSNLYIKAASQAVAPKAEKMSMTIGTEKVTYYKLAPKQEVKEKTVIFYLTGTGCHSINYLFYSHFSKLSKKNIVFGLQKKGVSHYETGRFNKQGCSKEYLEGEELGRQTSRHIAFIKKIVAKYQPKKVVLYGVSEGTFIAGEVARRTPEVTHIIFSAGDISKPMLEVFDYISKSEGFENIWKNILLGVNNQTLPDSQIVSGRTLGAWRSYIKDREPVIVKVSKLNKPVLLILGRLDKKIPVSSANIACRYSRVHNGLLDTVVFVDSGHKMPFNLRKTNQNLINNWISGEKITSNPKYTYAQCREKQR